MEEEVRQQLTKLLALVEDHPVIKSYQAIEARVQQHQGLQDLEEKIKVAQKEAVKFAHYDKPTAEKAALEKAEAYRASYDAHPLVIAYREHLIEANDLLQYVTDRIQYRVNSAIEEEDDHAAKN